MKKAILFLSALGLWAAASAQGNIPVTTDGDERVMTGFESVVYLSDEATFENACLWVINNVCEVRKDAIAELDFDAHTMQFALTVASPSDSKLGNQYSMKVSIRVQEHRLVYFINELMVLPRGGLAKNATPVSKLTPDTKQAHADILADLSQATTAVVNQMLGYVRDHKPQPVTHWDEIRTGKATKGMTTEECKLAFGKPQYVSTRNGEVQWMYSSNFYLFFIDGQVSTIIK